MSFIPNHIKPYFTLENISIFLLCIVFAGFYFLDTASHRIAFYMSFLVLIPYIHKKKIWKYINFRDLSVISLFIYLGLNVVSILWATPESIEDYFQNIKYGLFILIFMSGMICILTDRPDSLDYMLASLVISAFVFGGVLIVVNLPEIYDLLASQAHFKLDGMSRSGNPNIAAFLYCVSTLTLYFYKPKLSSGPWSYIHKKSIKVIFTLVFISIIFLTFSRNGLLSIALTFLIMSAISLNYKFLLPFLVIPLLLGVTHFVNPALFESLFARADSGRFEIWQDAYTYFLQAPILGHGSITELTYYAKDISHSSAHNIYLGHLNYLGIIGLTVFLIMALSFTVKAWKYLKDTKDALPLALFIHAAIWGMFEWRTFYLNLNPEWLASWTVVGILIAWELYKPSFNKPPE